MLIIKIVIVGTIFFFAIMWVSKKIIFSATDSDLNRLHEARLKTDKKHQELE